MLIERASTTQYVYVYIYLKGAYIQPSPFTKQLEEEEESKRERRWGRHGGVVRLGKR